MHSHEAGCPISEGKQNITETNCNLGRASGRPDPTRKLVGVPGPCYDVNTPTGALAGNVKRGYIAPKNVKLTTLCAKFVLGGPSLLSRVGSDPIYNASYGRIDKAWARGWRTSSRQLTIIGV